MPERQLKMWESRREIAKRYLERAKKNRTKNENITNKICLSCKYQNVCPHKERGFDIQSPICEYAIEGGWGVVYFLNNKLKDSMEESTNVRKD